MGELRIGQQTPARYRYTPYGEAHVESGPELLKAKYDGTATAVNLSGTTVTQVVAEERTAAAGALALDWSLGLDAATIAAGIVVERSAAGSGYVPVPAEELAIGPAPEDGGISAGGGGPPRLLVMTKQGWARGASYRVRLTPALADELGRSFGRTESLDWRVPEAPPAPQPIPTVVYEKLLATRYESWEAASDSLGGRFPGGQNALFQGLTVDPVTGLAYARARWYDARNAAWLSEDPIGPVDSANLYAGLGWQPNMATDPLGDVVRCPASGCGDLKMGKERVRDALRTSAEEARYLAYLLKPGIVRMNFSDTSYQNDVLSTALNIVWRPVEAILTDPANDVMIGNPIAIASAGRKTAVVGIAKLAGKVDDAARLGGMADDLARLQGQAGRASSFTSEEIAEELANATRQAPARTIEDLADDAGRMRETGPGRAGMTPCDASLHHLCTNKNYTATAQGGPWSPRFEQIFRKAGMDLDDALNQVEVIGHGGPHSEQYHQLAFDRLIERTRGLGGPAYREAVQDELRVIGQEARTPGTLINTLIQKPQ